MKNLFLLIFIVSALSSCMKVKNKNQPTESDPPQDSQKSFSSKQIDYEIISEAKANQYSVKFNFSNGALELAKDNLLFVKNSENNQIENIKASSENFWIAQRKSNEENLNYDFGYFENGVFKTIESFKIKYPQDLVIQEVTKWSSIKDHFEKDQLGKFTLKKFHRLYLEEKSILVTEGESINLILNDLYANNAVIETWPEGQKAAAGKSGRNGGQIVIHTKNAAGRLYINLRGESGADGQTGPVDEKLNGAPGLAGVDHEYSYIDAPSHCSYCLPKISCLKPPTNGGPGGPGVKGHSGHSGSAGGNSGFILLHYLKNSDFNWDLNIFPGAGGQGGAGGRGGIGGPGGKAGESMMSWLAISAKKVPGPCLPALDGQPGKNGESGDAGENGKNGLKETSCFTEGNKAALCL